jgi:hypothetical protein
MKELPVPRKQLIRILCLGLPFCLVIMGCKSSRPVAAPTATSLASVTPPPAAKITATVVNTTVGSIATLSPCPGKTNLPVSDAPLALYLPLNTQPAQYELVEFDLSTTTQVKNPYDPAQIDLVVNYTAPDGVQFAVPAFWFKDFDPITEAPCGQPGWITRFTPTQPGEWTA